MQRQYPGFGLLPFFMQQRGEWELNLVINESQPLWEYLRCAEKPVVLYGMGDGALKILAVCRQYGIPIAGIFASD